MNKNNEINENNNESNESFENNEESRLMIKSNNKSKYGRAKEKENKKINNKKANYIIIITFTFSFIFLIIIIHFQKELKLSLNKFFSNEQSIEKRPKQIINDTLIKELNEYMKQCKNGTLIYGIQKSFSNPKITAIIPVYNAQKTIKTTIRSIQNQNMSDIEILLIDDFSKDQSIKTIEELQNEDSRIKLLKNKQNRGTLYTRSIGALNSRGKYIMIIDNDDLFLKNIFNICYNEAELNNIDIIEFSGYNTYHIYYLPNSTSNQIINIPLYLQFKEDGLIVRQPELSNFMYRKENNTDNYTLIDALLWGKCIKKDIYKKALDLVGDIIYNEKIVWCEDRIVNFALLRVANSFKFIKKDGIIHYVAQETAGHKMMKDKKNRMFYQEFFYVMKVFNLTNSSEEDAKLSVFAFQDAWKLYFFGLNEENKSFSMKIYNDIIQCTNIAPSLREKLSIIVKNTLKKENEIFRYYSNIFE